MKVKSENIPQALKDIDSWVIWRKVPQQGKVPYNASSNNGYRAKSNDPNTWSSFDRALEVHNFGGSDGIGFVVSDRDPYTGIDFDACFANGVITDEKVKEYIDRLNSYTEVSPSGNGIRCFVEGVKPPSGCKKGKFEFYYTERYLTLTGQKLENSPPTIEKRQAELYSIHSEIFGSDSKVEYEIKDYKFGPLKFRKTYKVPKLKLDALLENIPEFKKSWELKQGWNKADGVTPDPSRYDLSLCSYAYQVGWSDQELVDLIINFRRHHEFNLKLNNKAYFKRTILKVRKISDQKEATNDLVSRIKKERDSPEFKKEVLEYVSKILGVDIIGITRFMGDKPKFVLKIGKEETRLPDTSYLHKPNKLQEFICGMAGVCIDYPKGKGMWDPYLKLLLAACEEEEVSSESRVITRIPDWIEQYTKQYYLKTKDEMMEISNNLPWKDNDGWIFIHIYDFYDWAVRNRDPRLRSGSLKEDLKQCGYNRHKITIHGDDNKKTDRRFWSLKPK